MPHRKARCPRRAVLLVCLAATCSVVSRTALAQTEVEVASARERYTLLKATAKPEGDLRREIDAIDKALADAIRAGNRGEAMRWLAKGMVRLSGERWNEGIEYLLSLGFSADRRFVDSAVPYAVRIHHIYPPPATLDTPLTARVSLHRPARAGATGVEAFGPLVRELGTFGPVPADLRASPFRFELNLAGVGDDRYVVELDVLNGNTLIARRGLMIDVTKNLDARLANLDARLRRVDPGLARSFGVDVRYPADFIRKVNDGIVETEEFDVARELAAAEDLVRSLEHGTDPFRGRTGDVKRHYFFADAGEIMPYHLYVPRGYTGRKPMPLVVALHGHGGDEDLLFKAPSLSPLAEERGYLIVAPLGYRTDGRYGAGTSGDPAVQRRRALSEADVMNVLALVRAQYRVDEDRIYVLGHSMGAAGAWHLGEKYPDLWAALACFSGSAAPESEARMKHLPQLVVHGDDDAVVPVARSRAMVAEMKRLGVIHRYLEVRGGDHSAVVDPNLPAAFDFFDRYRRKRSAGTGTRQE